MSGGKGGGQTTENTIPEWAKQPTIRNLARAEEVQKIGYMPYYGPDIAAFNPTQQTAMQSNMDAAAAFGLAAPGQDAMAGMPEAQDFGGISGYASAPIFEQAVNELEQKAPGYVREYNELFTDNTPMPGGGGKAGGSVGVGNPGSGIGGGSIPAVDNTGAGSAYPEPEMRMGRNVSEFNNTYNNPLPVTDTRVDPNPSSYVSGPVTPQSLTSANQDFKAGNMSVQDLQAMTSQLQAQTTAQQQGFTNLAIPTAQPIQAPAVNVDDQMLNMRYNKRNR